MHAKRIEFSYMLISFTGSVGGKCATTANEHLILL